MMRRLNQSEIFVRDEETHRHLQKSAGGNMVAIENQDVFTLGDLHRMIKIASLGVVVIWTNDVPNTRQLRELTKLIASTVVQNIDVQLVLRPIDGHRAQNGRAHNRQIFVVGRNIDIHRRPCGRVVRQRHRLALQRPDALKIAQHQSEHRINFGQDKTRAEQDLQRRLEINRLGQAPIEIARGHRQRQRHQKQRHTTAFVAIRE